MLGEERSETRRRRVGSGVGSRRDRGRRGGGGRGGGRLAPLEERAEEIDRGRAGSERVGGEERAGELGGGRGGPRGICCGVRGHRCGMLRG